MQQVYPFSTRRRGQRAALAIAAISGAIAIALPLAPAGADPVNPEPQPTPGQVNPDPQDPAAGEPGAAEPGRIDDPADGFSYLIPAGWVQSDATHLEYGSALLSKETGQPPMPGQPTPVANDTRIVLGKLDQRLYASAEADNAKAATRLGSDMGEFFMPYPGTRVNQESVPLAGNGLSGSASYYEVKFSDPAKPIGQIWTGVIGTAAGTGPQATPATRWFVVWLGTTNNPVDKVAAKVLAESIRPLGAPAPGAPAAGGPAPEGAPAAGTPT